MTEPHLPVTSLFLELRDKTTDHVTLKTRDLRFMSQDRDNGKGVVGLVQGFSNCVKVVVRGT